MKALAMRLCHPGCNAHVIGDMTAPPVSAGDVLFVSADPGAFSTVAALAATAKASGAQVICITAEPGGHAPGQADLTIHLPAQTMASDAQTRSILPMGSMFEVLMTPVVRILGTGFTGADGGLLCNHACQSHQSGVDHVVVEPLQPYRKNRADHGDVVGNRRCNCQSFCRSGRRYRRPRTQRGATRRTRGNGKGSRPAICRDHRRAFQSGRNRGCRHPGIIGF